MKENQSLVMTRFSRAWWVSTERGTGTGVSPQAPPASNTDRPIRTASVVANKSPATAPFTSAASPAWAARRDGHAAKHPVVEPLTTLAHRQPDVRAGADNEALERHGHVKHYGPIGNR
jgi:hypothetical protein